MKQDDLKELLLMEAENHLFALHNSESYGNSESPSVYITGGVLDGICKVTGISYSVEKRWRITFFKKNGKTWFSYTLEDITEAEADENLKYRKRRQQEESEIRSKFFV